MFGENDLETIAGLPAPVFDEIYTHAARLNKLTAVDEVADEATLQEAEQESGVAADEPKATAKK